MRQPQVRHQCCGGLRTFPLGGKQPGYLICFFAGYLVIRCGDPKHLDNDLSKTDDASRNRHLPFHGQRQAFGI